MPFPAEEVIEGARSDNHEPDFDWASESDFERWLNEAIQEVCQVSGILVDEYVIDLVANQQEYDLPDDFIRIKWAKFKDSGKKIHRRSERENDFFGRSENFSNVTYSTRQGPQGQTIFKLVPGPDSGDASVVALYVKSHATVTMQDTVNFPNAFKRHLVDYMNYRFQRRDNEGGLAQQDYQNWVRGLRRTIARVKNSGENTRAVDAQATKRKQYRSRY